MPDNLPRGTIGIEAIAIGLSRQVTKTVTDHAKRRVTLETRAAVGKTVVVKGEALVPAPGRKFD